ARTCGRAFFALHDLSQAADLGKCSRAACRRNAATSHDARLSALAGKPGATLRSVGACDHSFRAPSKIQRPVGRIYQKQRVKILFITSNRVGDAVLSSGVLAWLVEKYTDAEFTIACGPYAAGLFRAVPRLERLIVLEKKSWNRHWLELWQA